MGSTRNNSNHLQALGGVLKRRRNALGLSQEELADRAQLHRTYISDVERGTRNVTVKNLFRLAEALRIPASSLIRQAEKAKGKS